MRVLTHDLHGATRCAFPPVRWPGSSCRPPLSPLDLMEIPFLSSEEFDEQAHEFYNAGDYEEALRLLREGLSRYPESPELQVGVGYVRLAREEFGWARCAFDAALQLDRGQEDAWVGLGESLLKLGRQEEALDCFAHVAGLGMGTDTELGLAMGRALYREGYYHDSRQRLLEVASANKDCAEAWAALAYTLHALGDPLGARRELRRALRLDPQLHEARIYLAHLLFEHGDRKRSLLEMERVPPAEHWDPLSLWRAIELKRRNPGADAAEKIRNWEARLAELEVEPDAIDHLLAEVEASFEQEQARPPAGISRSEGAFRGVHPPRMQQADVLASACIHRVRTTEGATFTGTWEQIVARMRDSLADPVQPLDEFMASAAARVRELTGCDLPCTDPESFLRESARIGLLRIES